MSKPRACLTGQRRANLGSAVPQVVDFRRSRARWALAASRRERLAPLLVTMKLPSLNAVPNGAVIAMWPVVAPGGTSTTL
jgi:hypothetical protein